MERKKVIFAISSLQGNGAERFVLTLAKALNDLGHDAHIIYFRNIIDLPVPENINLHYFNYSKFRIIPKFMRAKIVAKYFDKFVEQNIGPVDLILSNLYPVDKILSYSKLKNIFFVIHNTTTQEYAGRLTPKLINSLSKIYLKRPCVGVSMGVTEDFKELFGCDSKITTIYNPIDVQQILETADEFIPDCQDYIVNVGKFKYQKRQDILIRAYAKANVPQNLVLVGKGKLLESCRKLVKELGIENKVFFVGFHKNPYPYIKHAKLMVLSSDFEGLGLVILEAITLNTPVISTDCPSGPKEILTEQQLVLVQDIDALAKKIRNALANPEDFKQQLNKEFLPKEAAIKYLNLIEVN